MRAKWMLVVFGPVLLTVIGSILVMLFVPHPVPKTATGGQRLYLTHCATCHAADGRGSWRARIFLMRPGDLSDPRLMDRLPDDYLLTLIKNGGATLGKPGMPSFGYHLTDDQLRDLISYLRTLPKRSSAGQWQGEAQPKASRADTRKAGRGAAEGEPSGYENASRQVSPSGPPRLTRRRAA